MSSSRDLLKQKVQDLLKAERFFRYVLVPVSEYVLVPVSEYVLVPVSGYSTVWYHFYQFLCRIKWA